MQIMRQRRIPFFMDVICEQSNRYFSLKCTGKLNNTKNDEDCISHRLNKYESKKKINEA